MTDIYLKNIGASQSFVHNGNKNEFSKLNWDVKYDGEQADIAVDVNKNGIHKEYDIHLDNKDLANIFNIPSVDMPIHKRLQQDFMTKSSCKRKVNVEEEDFETKYPLPIEYDKPQPLSLEKQPSVRDLLETFSKNRYFTSPLTNEEFVIPLNNMTSVTPRRKHRRHKTHKTYKLYKRPKTIRRVKMTPKTIRKRSNSRRTL